MPDIGTALRNALASATLIKDINAWEEEEKNRMPANQTTPTAPEQPSQPAQQERKQIRVVTLSEAIFEYVRDNPGCDRTQVVNALYRRGFNPTSITSLLTQYVRANMATRDAAGRYTMLIQKYAPIRTEPLKPGKDMAAARKEDYRRRAQKRLATLAAKKDELRQQNAAARQAKEAVGLAALKVDTAMIRPVPATIDVQALLNCLTLMQARALYDELKKLFGQ